MGALESLAEKFGLKVKKGKRGSVILVFPSENLELPLTQKKAMKLLMWIYFNCLAKGECVDTWNAENKEKTNKEVQQ